MAAIRPLDPDDIPAALLLWQGTGPLGKREVETERGLARFLERNPGISQVACDGDALIGIAVCGHDGRRGFLHHIGVAAARRRRGIAHKMVEACLAALYAEGITRVHVQLKLDNAGGMRFWKSLGCGVRKDAVLISLLLKSDDPTEGPDDA